jgi:hypothetical protein
MAVMAAVDGDELADGEDVVEPGIDRRSCLEGWGDDDIELVRPHGHARGEARGGFARSGGGTVRIPWRHSLPFTQSTVSYCTRAAHDAF